MQKIMLNMNMVSNNMTKAQKRAVIEVIIEKSMVRRLFRLRTVRTSRTTRTRRNTRKTRRKDKLSMLSWTGCEVEWGS